jgi:hypothetical protein
MNFILMYWQHPDYSGNYTFNIASIIIIKLFIICTDHFITGVTIFLTFGRELAM